VDFSSSDAYAAPLGLAALGGRTGWLSARWAGMLVAPTNDYYTFRVVTAASPGLHHGTTACNQGSGCSSTSLTLPRGAATVASAYKSSVAWAMSLLTGMSQCIANATMADAAGSSGCNSLLFGLGPEASDQDGAYVGMILYVSDYSASTTTAVLQQRTITSYSGASRVATLSSALNPSPSPSSVYLLLPASTYVVSGLAAIDSPVPGQLVLSAAGAPASDGALTGLISYVVKHDYTSGRYRPIQAAAKITAYKASNQTVWLDDGSSVSITASLTSYIIFGTPLGNANVTSYEPSLRRLNLSAGLVGASTPPSVAPGTTRFATFPLTPFDDRQ
jgi:hypothetical protein